MATPTPADYTTDPDIVACFDFEQGAVTADACGANALTAHAGIDGDTGDARWHDASALFDSSSQQYLSCTIGNCAAMSLSGPTQQITITCWANRTAATDGRFASIFAHEEDGNGGWAFFQTATNQFAAALLPDGNCANTGAYVTVTPSDILAAGTWYHLAMTSDNIDLKAYVNAGSPASTAYSSGICGSTADITIGAKPDTVFGTKDFFDGRFDECALFRRALSDREICDICRFGLDGQQSDRFTACNSCAATLD